MKVVGFKTVVSKKDSVKYVELHLVSEDRFVTGLRCDVVFVRADMIRNSEALVLDCDVVVRYNRYGRVDEVEVM